ncbi:membrane-associated Zn-dependent protease 1 [Serratia fonticola]
MRKKLLLTTLLMLSASINAKGVAHLTFHMAAGAEDKYKIGATIENKGDAEIHGGFIVLIPVGDKCTPLTPVLKTHGALAPGEKNNMEFFVDSKISGYRVAGLYAYDEYGYALETIDDTKEIIESRKEAEIKSCSSLD